VTPTRLPAALLTATLVGSALTTGGLVLATGVPAYADIEEQCTSITATNTYTEPIGTERASEPLEEMGVDEVADRLAAEGKQPGAGVVVAVIDSGVVTEGTGIPVVQHLTAGAKAPPAYPHGTAVAGLIAGPARSDDAGGAVGIAPGAQILDVQVYDDPNAEVSSQDASPITVANVRDGLRQVLEAMSTMPIKVVTIALALPADAEIAQQVQQLWDRGAIVVAPTGNRPDAEDAQTAVPTKYDSHSSGEDAAPDIHPADYPHVLAVNASMTGLPDGTDPASYVLENSRTAIAAPTANGVSYSVKGGTCLLSTPATSWAAAEVSGVLAVQQSYYDESPQQAVNRLLATANGRTDVPNNYVGAGEVQAFEALTRPLQFDDAGNVTTTGVVREEPQQVALPVDEPDILASARRNAVWWGLIGGGALLLALVLRPVLARRRRTSSSTL
jgi:membrane-anchored mycosin MYCP